MTIVQTTRSLHSLSQNAQRALKQRYQLGLGQRGLIVCDEANAKIGASFTQAALNLGARVDIFSLGQNRFSARNHQDLADLIIPGKYQFFINVIEGRVEEMADRLLLLKNQQGAKAKVIHAPGIEENMLEININYRKMMDNASRLVKAFENAKSVKIETDLGTDLELKIEGRAFHDDIFPRDQELGNFPCGEIYCAPIEDQANGIMLADGSASGFGIMPQPLQFEIKDGVITSLQWHNSPSTQDQSLLTKIRNALFQDKWSNVIGELGIGLAPYPICGNLLQDEKVSGTIHIAFGRNDFFGGQNVSESHIDFLVTQPTLTIYYSTHIAPRTILQSGRLLV